MLFNAMTIPHMWIVDSMLDIVDDRQRAPTSNSRPFIVSTLTWPRCLKIEEDQV
jgi:hypothetical protein